MQTIDLVVIVRLNQKSKEKETRNRAEIKMGV